MRIEFSIGIGMVNAVHDAVSARAQVGRTLRDVGEHKENALPGFAHRKRTVSGVAMQEKGLCKQGQIPVRNEEKDDNEHNTGHNQFFRVGGRRS
jgi:hypothetical protein